MQVGKQLDEAPRRLLYHPGDDASELVAEWLERPSLRRLVEAFGGTWPAGGPLADRLEHLIAFSQIWDHRRGGSRLEIGTGPHLGPPPELVERSADELGLVRQPLPTGDPADYVMILGGLATGTLARARYCAHLLEESAIRPQRGLVLLGSFRRLRHEEVTFLTREQPSLSDAATEVALLEQVGNAFFAPASPWITEVDGNPVADPHRASLRGSRAGSPPLRLFAAASSDPEHRSANTADTLEFAVTHLGISAGDYAQIVTSGIYAVYQFFDALRVLAIPFRITVEMIGVPPNLSLRAQHAAHLTQEVRSCLRSASALIAALSPR